MTLVKTDHFDHNSFNGENCNPQRSKEFNQSDLMTCPVSFGEFSLDSTNAVLRQNGTPVALTPKAFAVLSYLIENRGQLVSKDSLFLAVWPKVVVTEAALTVCIREIRKALKDSTRRPVYIETVYKRGFRFIAKINIQDSMQAEIDLVGRETALANLSTGLDKALTGQRQLLFISGEAGIGKTSLIDTYIDIQKQQGDYWFAQGQCIEYHNTGEPYLPLLDAVGRLCQQYNSVLPELLSQLAPSWLSHFPGLQLNSSVGSHLSKESQVSSESLIREMADALEAFCQIKPLILCLEDLHWCDSATAHFLSYLARRKTPSQLFIIGTLRPAETIVSNSVLRNIKQDLKIRGLCSQVDLELLTRANISQYLSEHFTPNHFPDNFAELIHQQTNGNPLFMFNVLINLQNLKLLRNEGACWVLDVNLAQLRKYIPENLREMINCQIEQMSLDKQKILEAAAIVGESGSIAAQLTLGETAAALDSEITDIELQLEQLSRKKHFISSVDIVDWPETHVTSHFEFTHALYQNVFYARTTPVKRIQMHRRIAVFLEDSDANRNGEVVSKLALHFELGRDYLKASHYLCESAKLASSLGASIEAIKALQNARILLEKINQSSERDQQELIVLQLLAAAMTTSLGNASAEIETVYLSALVLCEKMNDKSQQFPVLFGLRSFYLVTGHLSKAQKLADELLVLADTLNDPGLLLEAHVGAASCHFYLGNVQTSYFHALKGIKLYDQPLYADHVATFGLDPGTFCYVRAGQTAYAIGHQQEALNFVLKGVTLAKKIKHPYSQVFAMLNLSMIYLNRRESDDALSLAEQGSKIAQQYDFKFMQAWAYYLKAWVYAMQLNRTKAQQEIHNAQNVKVPAASTTDCLFNLLLAECYYCLADFDMGLTALQQPSSVHGFDVERLRLLAEFYSLKLQSLDSADKFHAIVDIAENYYTQALELVKKQGVKAYSLRIAVGFSDLLRQQNRPEEAFNMIKGVYQSSADNSSILDREEAIKCLEKCGDSLRGGGNKCIYRPEENHFLSSNAF